MSKIIKLILLVVGSIILYNCLGDTSKCTFNHNTCVLDIADKSLFVKHMYLNSETLGNSIEVEFKRDSLKDRINLCSLIKSTVSK
ncbi:MAG: hypothetical protein ACKO1F_18275, partial [Flammeovirgaceae bacterium]